MLGKNPSPFLYLLLGGLCLGTACQKSSSSKKSPESQTPETATLPLQDPSNPAANPVPVDPNTPVIGSEPVEPGGPSEPTTPTVPEPIPEPPVIPPTELSVKETQFWVYTKKDNQLSFNTPWDTAEGDGIERDAEKLPDYAKSCLESAVKSYQTLSLKQSFKDKMIPLLALGATPQLTFLTIVVDNKNERDNLRKLDRDAYFWHWNDPSKKPVLTMNVYEKGTWVWEVIASPGSCVQPDEKELLRYLDYAAKRFAEKGAKS